MPSTRAVMDAVEDAVSDRLLVWMPTSDPGLSFSLERESKANNPVVSSIRKSSVPVEGSTVALADLLIFKLSASELSIPIEKLVVDPT